MHEKAKAQIAMVTAAIIWGTSFPIGRFGVLYSDPLAFVIVRFSIASLILMPYIFHNLKKSEISLNLRWMLILGATNAFSYAFQYLGLEITTASKTSVIINSYVIVVAILAHFMLNERLNIKQIFGILMGVIGIIMMFSNGNPLALFENLNLGDFFCLLASISWGVYIVYTRKVMREQASSPIVTGVVLIETGLFLQGAWLLIPEPMTAITLPIEAILAVVYLAIACTIFAFLLYNYALKQLGATTSSVYTLLEIVSAVIISIIFLNEVITIWLLFGIFSVFVAILLV